MLSKRWRGTATTCTIQGKSRSESVSVLDNGVNYCNLWNVYNGVQNSGIATFQVTSVTHCSVEPSDPVSNCARY